VPDAWSRNWVTDGIARDFYAAISGVRLVLIEVERAE
jgi:hypothetical protein